MRVLLADDHDLVRESIGAVLEQNDFHTVDYADSLESALSLIEQHSSYDLVMLDYDMPGMNGLDGLSRMLKVVGKTPVALLSGTISPDVADRALKIGASGYIPKTLSSRSMISAAKFIIAGETYAPISFLQERPKDSENALSKREEEVLHGICEGKSNKEIARDLSLQEVTVKLHVKTLCRKLNARNRTQAAMIARDLSLL